MVLFKVLYRYLPGMTEENQRRAQDNRYLDRSSNRKSLAYLSEALLLEPASPVASTSAQRDGWAHAVTVRTDIRLNYRDDQRDDCKVQE